MDCQHFPVRITREVRGSVPTAIIRCERCGLETKPRIHTGGNMDTMMLWEDWALLMTAESAGRKARLEQDQGQPMTSFYRSSMDAFDKAARESFEKRAAEMKGVPVVTVPSPAQASISPLEMEREAACWVAFRREAFKDALAPPFSDPRAAAGIGYDYRHLKSMAAVVKEHLGPKANKDTLGLVLAAAKRFRNVIDNVAKGKET